MSGDAITFFIALLAAWAVLTPFFEPAPSLEVKASDRDIQQSVEKERVILLLTELEADYRAGKIEKKEYERIKSELSKEASVYF
jgi:hypothetical protein